MRVERALFFGVILSVALSWGACTRSMEMIPGTEVLPESSEAAQKSVESRLAHSAELRLKFRHIIRALNQADAFFTDLANAITVKTDGARNPAKSVQELLRAIRESLQESTRGLINQKSDGTWTLERDLALSFRAYASGACQTTRLKIYGHRLNNEDQAELSLQDCQTAKPITIAKVELGRPGSDVARLVFYPKNLETFLPNVLEARGEKCSVSGDAVELVLACDEMYFGGTDWGGVVRPFEVRQNSRGVSAVISSSVAVVIGQASRTTLEVDGVLTAEPGAPTRLQIDLRRP